MAKAVKQKLTKPILPRVVVTSPAERGRDYHRPRNTLSECDFDRIHAIVSKVVRDSLRSEHGGASQTDLKNLEKRLLAAIKASQVGELSEEDTRALNSALIELVQLANRLERTDEATPAAK